MPKKIYPEGAELIYYTEADGLPEAKVVGWQPIGIPTVVNLPEQNTWENLIFPNMADVRLIFLETPIMPGSKGVYFLHWDDGTDLEKLDMAVLQESSTDNDFKYSIKSEFGRTGCFECGWEGKTLVVSAGSPYIGAPGLLDKKIQLRASRSGFLNCPKCGANLRQNVVKIFGDKPPNVK